MTNPAFIRLSTGVLAAAALAAPPAVGQNYAHDYQAQVGEIAHFHVVGPGTEVAGQSHNPQGDVFLKSVEMPNGETFTHFYKPIAVTGMTVGSGDGKRVAVNGGSDITVGTPGKFYVGREVSDGNENEPTAADVAAFTPRVLEAMQSTNLNHYFDNSGRNPYFEFVMEFDLPLKDNDPDADDFGELLYTERGAGFGNSWITIQAVDADGNALGPALAVSPFESRQTNPPTQVTSNSSQYIGAVSVDISRLGVSETRFLKVRKTSTSDDGYSFAHQSQEDFNPDFKFMAVITHPDHIAQRVAGYD